MNDNQKLDNTLLSLITPMEKGLQLAKKQIKRILISQEDISEAAQCAYQLLKHKYYKSEYLDRDENFENTDEYVNMKALTTTLVVAYSRPFTKNSGGDSAIPIIPKKIMSCFNVNEMALHGKILNLRNKAFAHSDADLFNTYLSFFEKNIIPVYLDYPLEFLHKQEIELFQKMVEKYEIQFCKFINEIFKRYGDDAITYLTD